MPLSGDFNADGKTDLLQITPTGDPWVSLSDGTSFQAPKRWGWISFYYNEDTGHYPITADVNCDGKTDLIQITPEGESRVSFSKGDSFTYPEYWGMQGFKFSREEHRLPFYLSY
jgi:VCBS repeat protein